MERGYGENKLCTEGAVQRCRSVVEWNMRRCVMGYDPGFPRLLVVVPVVAERPAPRRRIRAPQQQHESPFHTISWVPAQYPYCVGVRLPEEMRKQYADRCGE